MNTKGISIARVTFIALTLALMPGSAWAQSCADQRPNWIPGTDVSAVAEAIALLSSPFSLILIIATVLCLRFKIWEPM